MKIQQINPQINRQNLENKKNNNTNFTGAFDTTFRKLVIK